jgi:hypothetical protein
MSVLRALKRAESGGLMFWNILIKSPPEVLAGLLLEAPRLLLKREPVKGLPS